MANTRIIIAVLLMMTIILTGCGTGDDTKTVTTKQAKQSVESVLEKEISQGKLVEVYDEYVRLGPGETAQNWIIIQNVRDREETFTIQPCSGCDFEQDEVTLAPGEHIVVSFAVSAEQGEKEIRVKDSYKNAYGFAKFNVITE
jgi:hypothetical protein